MGTNVSIDWKEGSAISYEGDYNGKKYHDKGVIKKIEPGKLFQSTGVLWAVKKTSRKIITW
jgi:hypothetical protein